MGKYSIINGETSKKQPFPDILQNKCSYAIFRCFPVNIAKFSRTAFFIEHVRFLSLTLKIKHRITSIYSCCETKKNIEKITLMRLMTVIL